MNLTPYRFFVIFGGGKKRVGGHFGCVVEDLQGAAGAIQSVFGGAIFHECDFVLSRICLAGGFSTGRSLFRDTVRLFCAWQCSIVG